MQRISEARADSLRAALDSTFAAPEYRWETRSDPLAPLSEAILRWLRTPRARVAVLVLWFAGRCGSGRRKL